MAYLFRAFVSFFARVAAFGFTDSVVLGVVVAVVATLIAVYLSWERGTFGGEAGDFPDGERGRIEARNAGAYSQIGHGGGYFGGSDGGEASRAGATVEAAEAADERRPGFFVKYALLAVGF
jgi:prepilin signal peptidase PulO-like enzyme (type II secretory pathway)